MTSKKGDSTARQGKARPGKSGDRHFSERKQMERSLLESEQKFARIFQNNAAAITLARLSDGKILDVNEKWHELFGYSRREVIGRNSATGLRIWKDPEERRRFYKALADRGGVQNLECRLLRKNGEEWTALLSSAVVQMRGEAVAIGFLQDITAMKRIQEENHSLAKFPSENPNPVLRLTPSGAILYANAAARVMLGSRKREGAVSVPGVLKREIRAAFVAGTARTIDLALRGRIYACDILPLADGGYVNVYGRDETGRRRAEEALRASEARYRSLFEAMTEAFALHEIICDKKGMPRDSRFLEVNPAFERITGLKREAVVGRRFREMLPAGDHHLLKVLGEVALTGQPVHAESYSTAQKRHFIVNAFSPMPGQFAVLFADVSEERTRNAELRQLNRTLQALGNSSQALMQAVDERTYLKKICRIIVSDCGHKMTWIGWREDDREKSVRPVAHAGFERGYLKTLRLTWADTERGRGPTGTAMRTGKPVICRNMLEDPRFAPWREEARRRGYRSSLALPLLSAGRAFGAITIYSQEMDPFSQAEVELLGKLAERLAFGIQALRLRREHARAEEELRETRNYLEKLINYANAPIIVWDPRFRIIRFNHAFERLTGYDAAQVRGKPLDMLFPDYGKAGSLRLIRDTLMGRHWEGVEISLLQKGGTLRTVLWNSANIHDKKGRVVATIAQGQDISERKQSEKRMADSLYEKETLLRELYHRTKNNLNVISSLIALQGAAVSDRNVQRMFADMQSRIRAISLVHEKLYQSPDLGKLDMSEYINELAHAILSGFKQKAMRVVLKLEVESVRFPIDAAITCGLVINELMTNSLKYAFPEEMSGEIGISLRMPPGEKATLRYQDDGIGFPDGFDPAKSTSLGLKMVHSLVKKQLLGSIEFADAQGMMAMIHFAAGGRGAGEA